ncbi:Nuclease-related domain-containing protein [Alkalibacterium subtropicum]|uniref:Nuclease-related domain-containing protein n=1 Tax=Alkalibacterium subtropicum TaxID=753702 RepID=A0A1I1FQJ1_9LACT|nr:HRDC domain-containing protein [Alkalibacterium subtropicum]SFC01604.1 Nuclease-related domain-containing protein [Alkalibacterium subtropicum]
MSLFSKMKEPVFLKENSNAEEQLKMLKSLEPTLNAEGVKILKQDIKNLEYGIIGEKKIEFELKNSHMPMYVLHDIYLEEDDLSAQIDYLVFTKKLCFIIESKNLYGDIEINNAGDFIRTTEFNRRKKKEGIYSPITQNQRHMDLMKKIRLNSKSNILTKSLSERRFEEFNKPVVVLANPKTVLNAKSAEEEVKDKVIRADQLVKYIKDAYKKSNRLALSDKDLLMWAYSYLEVHKDTVKDYTSKYEPYKLNMNEQGTEKAGSLVSEKKPVVHKKTPVKNPDIFKELKDFRLNKSREEEIKAYYIFSNKQLKTLVEKMPKSKQELRSIEGFGVTKVTKYGDDIVGIIQKY